MKPSQREHHSGPPNPRVQLSHLPTCTYTFYIRTVVHYIQTPPTRRRITGILTITNRPNPQTSQSVFHFPPSLLTQELRPPTVRPCIRQNRRQEAVLARALGRGNTLVRRGGCSRDGRVYLNSQISSLEVLDSGGGFEAMLGWGLHLLTWIFYGRRVITYM